MAALILGHRGASATHPENTLAAFAAALADGADGVELDVRRTHDGVLVVHHDPLGAVTYAELCAGVPEDRRPPRLEEVVALVAGRGLLDVELKEAGYEEQVLAVLPTDGVVVTSFLAGCVARLQTLRPGLRTGWLCEPDGPEPFSWDAFLATGAALLAPALALAEAGVLHDAGAHGVPVAVWTVNDGAQLRRLLPDPRVEAVITDVPARAVELRRG